MTSPERLDQLAPIVTRLENALIEGGYPVVRSECEDIVETILDGYALCGSPQAQAVKVPSVVGFYWVRMYEDEWTVARVYATACVPGGLVAKAGIGTFAVDAPALTDWHGPLATPQAPEGA